MYIQINTYCTVCGGEKHVDTVNRETDMRIQGLPVHSYSFGSNVEVVERCYCGNCGLLFHPASIGVQP